MIFKIRDIFLNRFIYIYLATGLAFLSQIIRDFIWLEFFVNDSATFYSQLYLSQVGLALLGNLLLFKAFEKNTIYILASVLLVSSIISYYYIGYFYIGALLFFLVGVMSVLLGNVLLFRKYTFLSVLREFFIQFLILILILILGIDLGFYLYLIMIAIVLFVFILFTFEEKFSINGLSLKSSFLFNMPIVFTQIFFYFMSLQDFYGSNPLILRLGVYSNAIILSPLILIKDISYESKTKLLKIMSGVFIISFIMLIFIISIIYKFDIFYVIGSIMFGVLSALLTYIVALNEFVKVHKTKEC